MSRTKTRTKEELAAANRVRVARWRQTHRKSALIQSMEARRRHVYRKRGGRPRISEIAETQLEPIQWVASWLASKERPEVEVVR